VWRPLKKANSIELPNFQTCWMPRIQRVFLYLGSKQLIGAKAFDQLLHRVGSGQVLAVFHYRSEALQDAKGKGVIAA
jgi:hypothetical protein